MLTLAKQKGEIMTEKTRPRLSISVQTPIRTLYPWVAQKPPEFNDFKKFKEQHPELPDRTPKPPKNYVRTPLCNWEYMYGNKKPDISKHWYKDDKPRLPIHNINPSHENDINVYDIIEDPEALKNLAKNEIYYSQNDNKYQVIARLSAGGRNRFARYDEAKEQKLRKSVHSRSRITPLIRDDKEGRDMAKKDPQGFGTIGKGLDATHIIPFGYHGSESDTRLLIMFPSSYNRGVMKRAENKASNWHNDVIWFASIEIKYKVDGYEEEKIPLYDEEGNPTGEYSPEVKRTFYQNGRYLDWHYYIIDAENGETVVDEHYIVDSSPKFGGRSNIDSLEIEWNIGADETEAKGKEMSSVADDSIDYMNGVNPCLLQDKSKWKYSREELFQLNSKGNTPTETIFGQRADNNEPFVASLEEMVHLLVAGTTGSGKSVAVDSAIFKNIQAHSTPDDVQYMGIDPKFVEYGQHIGSPYWTLPPQMLPDGGKMHDNSLALMLYIADMMDCRYKMLSAVEAKNITEYNEWVLEHSAEAKVLGLPYLPRLIVPIDEYADLVAVVGEEIEDIIKRLGAKGRACGVILIVTTQRPTADVINTTLRSNLPSRWCLTVADSITSNVALGEDGAENLTGRGDGLIKLQGAETVRVFAWYYNPDETESINRSFADNYPPQEDEPVFNYIVYNKLGEYMDMVTEETQEAEKFVKLFPPKERRGGKVS